MTQKAPLGNRVDVELMTMGLSGYAELVAMKGWDPAEALTYIGPADAAHGNRPSTWYALLEFVKVHRWLHRIKLLDPTPFMGV